MTDQFERRGDRAPRQPHFVGGQQTTGSRPQVSDVGATTDYTNSAHQGRVTEDFGAGPVGPVVAVPAPPPGTVMGSRYAVCNGQTGQAGGESLVLPGIDRTNNQRVAVKIYQPQCRPKNDLLFKRKSLNHPNIVSLLNFGFWDDCVYEVMEWCDGGSFGDHMPVPEATVISALTGIVDGLDYCHQHGLIHRDIKPNNILFRDPERTQVAIVDFGISSVLDDGDRSYGVRKTDTFRITVDYTAPEVLRENIVSAKSDYYALGITLVHVLAGLSPFHGMFAPQIPIVHAEGKIPLPDTLSADVRTLLRGLLQVEPDNRWGRSQVCQWLTRVPVTDDQGRLWQDDTSSGRKHPYPGYPDALNPRHLARCLDRFDSRKQLFRGDIRRWVFDHFDHRMAEQLYDIEENDTGNPDFGLFKTRFVLDPTLPLLLGAVPVHTPQELAAAIDRRDHAVIQALTAIKAERLIYWLIEVHKVSRSYVDDFVFERERNSNRIYSGIFVDCVPLRRSQT